MTHATKRLRPAAHDLAAGALVLAALIAAPAQGQARRPSLSTVPAGSPIADTSRLSGNSASRSLMGAALSPDLPAVTALHDISLISVPKEAPRIFRIHDLIQIVVREQQTSKHSQDLELDKEFSLNGSIGAFPELRLEDLLQLQLFAGRATMLPELDVELGKSFEGDGKYSRTDDVTARLTAEVIEVLPNGNLVLEARTFIQSDEEQTRLKVTGICSPDHVQPDDSVLSNRIHDLRIEKCHEGELKQTTRKGLVPRFFEYLFAF